MTSYPCCLSFLSSKVGDKITLADITVASALVYPMKLVVSPEYRKAFPCVTRWFTTCVNQPQFKAVIGTVELAKEEMTAEGAPKAPKKEKVRPLERTCAKTVRRYSLMMNAAVSLNQV